MTGSDVYWACWATAALVSFAIPEALAVFGGHPERKLSDSIWRAVDASRLPPSVWRMVAIAGIVVLIYHLFLGPRH